MGRYLRKPKSIGEVAVMEVHQSTIGVRTRAKTLALQSLDSSSYLELRSRRLEKHISLIKPKEPFSHENPNPNPKLNPGKSSSNPSAMNEIEDKEVEVSFGENFLDFEARDRSIRETTPCSLTRDSETITTPVSTTRRTNSKSTNVRIQNSTNRNIPTTNEMEEFFACAERLQQRIFTEKYNFDPVNDCPLLGRYEWVKVE